MAKLDGFFIEGTSGNVCVYRMNGQTYVRSKSSLTRKRVLKTKAFEKTRKYAADLGKAARLGSAIYREMPYTKLKNRSLYQAITGEAASMLYRGIDEQEVRNMLRKKYLFKPPFPAQKHPHTPSSYV